MADTAFEFDPYSHALHDNPYPVYKQLRDEHPLYYNPRLNFYALSRYGDIFGALRDFKTYSLKFGPSLEHQDMNNQLPTVLSLDPPDHTRVRRVLQDEFTPAHVAPLADAVRSLVRELLEPHLATGKIDLLDQLAVRLPTRIFCRLLGVPREDEDTIRTWTDDIVHRDEGQLLRNERNDKAAANVLGYFTKFIADRDKRGEVKNDLIGILMQARDAGTISHAEVMGYLFIGAIGGHETTAKTIGNMTYQLWKHPDQRQILLNDPTQISAGIEETVRFDGPIQLMCRTTLKEVEVHGQIIPEGSKVALLYISGNRDHRKYENAESYLVTRNSRDHLGFGGGIHACQGAALGRLQVRIAMEEILKAIPDYEINEAGLTRMHSTNVRGFKNVPLTFKPR